MLRYGMFTAASMLLGVPAASAGDLKESLLAHEESVTEAIKHKDTKAIARLLSDQQIAITANGGRFCGADLKGEIDALDITAYRFSDAKLVDVDENVKILTYTSTWSGTLRGEMIDNASVYATVVWAHRDGEWKSIFYQETPVTN